MWNSIPFLQALNSWALVIAMVTGVIAAAAGFLSGLAGNRLNDLQKAAHEREIEAMRLKTAELEKQAVQMRNDVDFVFVSSMN